MTLNIKNISNFYDDSYAIELYLGEKRSGKTLSMVAKTYLDIKKFSFVPMIYTNLKLNTEYFKNTHIINKDEILNFHRNGTILKYSLFLFDEIHTICDSRDFMKKENLAMSYFLGQIGKRKNILRGNTHFPNLVDRRVRQYTEKIINVEKGFNIDGDFCKLKNYNKILTPEEDKALLIRNLSFINKIDGFGNKITFDSEKFIEAHKYYHLYDTEEYQVKE